MLKQYIMVHLKNVSLDKGDALCSIWSDQSQTKRCNETGKRNAFSTNEKESI